MGRNELRVYYQELDGSPTRFPTRRHPLPPKFEQLRQPLRDLRRGKGRLDALQCNEVDDYVSEQAGRRPDTVRKLMLDFARENGVKGSRAHRYEEVAKLLDRYPTRS